MSKEMTAKLNQLRDAMKVDTAKADHANIDLAFDIAGEVITNVMGINANLGRIADSLEKRATIAPIGEGVVMGELAKFEPAIDPKMVERLVDAVEKLARSPNT